MVDVVGDDQCLTRVPDKDADSDVAVNVVALEPTTHRHILRIFKSWNVKKLVLFSQKKLHL